MKKGIQTVHQLTLSFMLVAIILMPGWAAAPQATPVSCENNLGSPIPNFCQVSPNKLWRGAKPDKDGVVWLLERGVRTIVNLEMLHDDEETFEHVSLDNKAKYEIAYYRVRDWEPLPAIASSLSDEHVAYFLAIMEQAPKPVYVHCRSGENRTGLIVAAYRVIVEGEGNDKALEAAIAEMEGYQGYWFKTDEKYIRGLTPERREAIRRKAKLWLPKLKEDARFVCENGGCRVDK